MGLPTDHSGRGKKPGSQLWKKALLHSCLCFVMGFFTGFAPSSVSDWTSAAVSTAGGAVASSHLVRPLVGAMTNRSLLAQDAGLADPQQRPLLVVVTTTESTPKGERAAALTRMAHTLRLVPPPLLWVVVEAAADVPATARMLRATGIMYRHLAYKDNFTAADVAAGKERHHQRNVALGHVEHHRLAGVVHFAGLGDVFDLRFFDQLREIRAERSKAKRQSSLMRAISSAAAAHAGTPWLLYRYRPKHGPDVVSAFGAWPVATMSRDERKVVVRGPVCSSSAVTGWFSQDFSNGTAAEVSTARPREVDVNGFAFNSSVLWDPERWGRYPTSEPDKSQDSMKFVQQVALEDFSKVKGIPSDCSEVMVWQVDTTVPSTSPSSQQSLGNKRR
ncbi:hypothetical protein PR202_gb19483 [Eleusine coracana subsp. coracana]|uniref:Glycosyltransferases n=1 Tax=Eleusine coracana subsp. coracana TaxID=191504 RepID=A0AAV5F635_ELECO|nr:hypothetical protein PR202_gb19483 [Eleusine coracana subsp. coracana]